MSHLPPHLEDEIEKITNLRGLHVKVHDGAAKFWAEAIEGQYDQVVDTAVRWLLKTVVESDEPLFSLSPEVAMGLYCISAEIFHREFETIIGRDGLAPKSDYVLSLMRVAAAAGYLLRQAEEKGDLKKWVPSETK